MVAAWIMSRCGSRWSSVWWACAPGAGSTSGGETPAPHLFRAHGDDLFVAHYAIAELKYLFRLGVTPPARWFDTYIAWRLRHEQAWNTGG